MAEGLEESDTDERERPGPSSKRQRILAPRTNLDSREEEVPLQSQEQQMQPEDSGNSMAEFDHELERRSREKLHIWQARQFTTGCVDNAINKVLENYIMFPPNSYPFEDPWYCLLHGNRMEDTAVTMAIHNHGVFRTLELPHSPSHDDERISTRPEDSSDVQSPLSNTSTETLICTNSETTSTSDEDDWLHTMCDNEHRQDFLDRAVAEAIKKKGLSTLSADYG